MQKLLKFALVSAMFAGLAASLSACSSSNSIDASKFAAVIDVRTPSEFAAGHLQGAINIDVEGATFVSQIEALNRSADYLLYCHSGRRAGIAIETMKQDGFTGNLVNAGGFADASTATGLALVTN